MVTKDSDNKHTTSRSATSTATSLDTARIVERVDALGTRFGPSVLRWLAALMWLANVSWKVPTEFGSSANGCSGFCRFVEAGAEFPVAPGSAWFFDNVASTNLTAFGWITLFTEATLVMLLVSGRFVRIAAVLGAAMSLGIGLAVANAEGEWYWSYLLMIGVHIGILVTTQYEKPQTAKTMAGVLGSYGLVVAINHAGAGLTGSGDWELFSQANDFPGDWGRGTFPGSIGLGLIFIVIAVAAWIGIDRLNGGSRRILGWALVGVSALLLLTYRADGLIIGLGSRAASAAMLAALGIAIAVPVHGRKMESVP